MTRVDFYVLAAADATENGRWQIAGRLAEKAYGLGHAVHLHVANSEHMQKLDQFLWTWRDASFLPHACLDDDLATAPGARVPVTLGAGQEPLPDTEILINLGDEVPGFFSRMERVMEIVGGDEKTRSAARQRFRFYRDRGYDLTSHNL